MHGSATQKARNKAMETILLASYPAARKVKEIMDDPSAPYGVKLSAAKDLLDRAEVGPRTTVEVQQTLIDQTIQAAVQIVHHGRPEAPDVPPPERDYIDAEVVTAEGFSHIKPRPTGTRVRQSRIGR